MAKVNYQYEKRQKELEKLEQSKKNFQPTETQGTQEAPEAQPQVL